jgi:integrase
VVVELPRDPETGKRRQKWVTVKGAKRDAERALAEMITEVERGCYGMAPAKLTVGEYLDMWLDAVKAKLRAQTYTSWRCRLRYWRQALGGVPLSKLTPLDVQRAVNAMSESYASTTRGTIYAPFRIAMRQAVKWGLIPRSPTDGVSIPSPLQRKMTVWTEEQVTLFLQATRRSRHFALFHTALATGMRLGELLGLTWEDVDLNEGVIHVRRSLIPRFSEPVWQEPKTPRSRRKVPLDPVSVEILRQRRRQQIQDRLKAGPAWHEYNLVFTTHEGRPLRESYVLSMLKYFAGRAGVPPIRFHDLRHTHATILLRQGVHPKVVAERLGHTRVSFTLEVYSHVLPDTQREAIKAMERVWRGSPVSKRLATPQA